MSYYTCTQLIRCKPSTTESVHKPTDDSTQVSWRDVLQISRPPMWFASVFPYLMCLKDDAYNDPTFWVGLFYVVFPFNLLLFALNDFADWDVDRLNPKKRRSAWRGILAPVQLKFISMLAIGLQLPFFLWMNSMEGKHIHGSGLFWVSTALQVSLYNGFFGLPQLSRYPLVDLPLNLWAWLLPLHFSLVLNDGTMTDLPSVVFWSIQVMSGQAIAATHDIRSDRIGRKFTTATLLGKTNAIILGAFLWLLQSLIAFVFNLTHSASSAIHGAFGLGVLLGKIPIKYAYPAGFLFDIDFLAESLPVANQSVRVGVITVLAMLQVLLMLSK